jgi:hypothetical protein
MEITNRFPQPLGNLAQNARFPHSHKPIPFSFTREERMPNSLATRRWSGLRPRPDDE